LFYIKGARKWFYINGARKWFYIKDLQTLILFNCPAALLWTLSSKHECCLIVRAALLWTISSRHECCLIVRAALFRTVSSKHEVCLIVRTACSGQLAPNINFVYLSGQPCFEKSRSTVGCRAFVFQPVAGPVTFIKGAESRPVRSGFRSSDSSEFRTSDFIKGSESRPVRSGSPLR
jgi:hypothetical protein